MLNGLELKMNKYEIMVIIIIIVNNNNNSQCYTQPAVNILLLILSVVLERPKYLHCIKFA